MDEPERVSILLVDDRPGNLLSLQAILERPDYDLVLATSGPEALNLVLRREFALILLDVAMPEMDGFEVAAILKQRDRYRRIPIIFVTASVQQIEWIFRAYSVGAVDFLQKPLDPHAVRAKVAVFVELFRQKKEIERQAEQLTESERRERELEVERLQLESERRYRNLAEAIPHIVWTADTGGRILYFNQQWRLTTGMSEVDSTGLGWRDAVHPEDRSECDAVWARAVAQESPVELQLRLRQCAGQYRWYLLRALPERNGRSGVARWLGTFTDIDAQRAAQEKTEAAVRLRDEFLTVASHELRTPLTALRLQIQGLIRKLLTEESVREGGAGERRTIERKLELALRQTDRMANLVEGLLDVSRIASGSFELHRERFDLVEAVRDVLERFRDEAQFGGSELRLVAERPAFGSWDRGRIQQVVENLVANALKYGAGAPVDLRVTALDEGVELTVRDHGIGIERADVRRIFERFERAVPSRQYGGLGLGLYIVRQIIEAHGGRIGVGSTKGAGSTFVVMLPSGPRGDESDRSPAGHEHGELAVPRE